MSEEGFGEIHVVISDIMLVFPCGEEFSLPRFLRVPS